MTTTLAQLLRETATEYLNRKFNSENVAVSNENTANKSTENLNLPVDVDRVPVVRVTKSRKKRAI